MAASLLAFALAYALTPANAEEPSMGAVTTHGHALADVVTPIKNKVSDAKRAQEEKERQRELEEERKEATKQAAREEAERQEREAAELAAQQEAERQAQEAAELAAQQEEEARLAAEKSAQQAEADQSDRTVYTTQTGSHYHFDRHCRGLSRAKSVSEATLGSVIGWLEPCSYCAY